MLDVDVFTEEKHTSMTHDNNSKIPFLPAAVRLALARQAPTATKLALAQVDRTGREATAAAWDQDAYGLTFPHVRAQTPAQWREACKFIGNVADLMRRGATPQALVAVQAPEVGLIAAQLAGWVGKHGGEAAIFESLVDLERYEDACRYLSAHPAAPPAAQLPPGGPAPEAGDPPTPPSERPVDTHTRARTAQACLIALDRRARHHASLTPLVGALLATGAHFSPASLDNDALHAAWTAAHRAGGARPPPALNHVGERLRVAICSGNLDALDHLLTHHAAALQAYPEPVFCLFHRDRERLGRDGHRAATDAQAMALLLRAHLVGQPCWLRPDVRRALLEALARLDDREVTAAFVAARGAAGETWMHEDSEGAIDYARLGLSPFFLAAGHPSVVVARHRTADTCVAILEAFAASGAVWPPGYAEFVDGGDAVAFWRQRARHTIDQAAPTLMACAAWAGDLGFMSWLTETVAVDEDTTAHAIGMAIERGHWAVLEAFSASISRASRWPVASLCRALHHAERLSVPTIGRVLEAIEEGGACCLRERAMAEPESVRALCLTDLQEPIVWRGRSLVDLLVHAGAAKTVLDVCPQWFEARGLEGLCATRFNSPIWRRDSDVAAVIDACVARGMAAPTSLPMSLITYRPDYWARKYLWFALESTGEARASILALCVVFDVPCGDAHPSPKLAQHEVPLMELWLARSSHQWAEIRIATLRALLASGIDANLRCFGTGETLMHRAETGSELRAALVAAGARRDIPDLQGRLPA